MDQKTEVTKIPDELIMQRIILIRGIRVMIDSDIAQLYGVSTKRLNEQVKRNLSRFPPDFMFQLTANEKEEVVANCDHLGQLKFSPYLPYAFTEHGIVMLASVLSSERAIKVNVMIVRIFNKIREMLSENRELFLELEQIRFQLKNHEENIITLFNLLRKMNAIQEQREEQESRIRIGFK